jgi:hypothetical protein
MRDRRKGEEGRRKKEVNMARRQRALDRDLSSA